LSAAATNNSNHVVLPQPIVPTLIEIDMNATQTTSVESPQGGNFEQHRQFVWLYVNLITKAAIALGLPTSNDDIRRHVEDFDGLAMQYLERWLNRDHPNWQADLVQLMEANGERSIRALVAQTGRSPRAIELIQLVRERGWNEDDIANGLLAVLANNQGKYKALITDLMLSRALEMEVNDLG
jgi:hypothetical protein